MTGLREFFESLPDRLGLLEGGDQQSDRLVGGTPLDDE